MIKDFTLDVDYSVLDIERSSFIFHLFTDHRLLSFTVHRSLFTYFLYLLSFYRLPITDYLLPPFTVHSSPFTYFLYLLSFIFASSLKPLLS
jgi:hypothetical protein